jgi:hypothetical protein
VWLAFGASVAEKFAIEKIFMWSMRSNDSRIAQMMLAVGRESKELIAVSNAALAMTGMIDVSVARVVDDARSRLLRERNLVGRVRSLVVVRF